MTWHAFLFWIYATIGVSEPIELRAETTGSRPTTTETLVVGVLNPAQISNGF